jgi:hypothetical protein
MGVLDTEIEAQLVNVGLHVRLGSGIIKKSPASNQLIEALFGSLDSRSSRVLAS